MREHEMNLDVSAQPRGNSGTWPWKRAIWLAAGVALLAALVVVHQQRPTPRLARPLETIAVPGNGLGDTTEGNRGLVTVDIKNIGHNPVTGTTDRLMADSGLDVADLCH